MGWDGGDKAADGTYGCVLNGFKRAEKEDKDSLILEWIVADGSSQDGNTATQFFNINDDMQTQNFDRVRLKCWPDIKRKEFKDGVVRGNCCGTEAKITIATVASKKDPSKSFRNINVIELLGKEGVAKQDDEDPFKPVGAKHPGGIEEEIDLDEDPFATD